MAKFDVYQSLYDQNPTNCTIDKFAEICKSGVVNHICDRLSVCYSSYVGGDLSAEEYNTVKNQLKRQLPGFTFMCTTNGKPRVTKNATYSGNVMLDYDHLDNPREAYETLKGFESKLGIVLVHITPSGHGLRIVARMEVVTDIINAQRNLAASLKDAGFSYKADAACKDLIRFSYAVPANYILYLLPSLFDDVDAKITGNDDLPVPTPASDNILISQSFGNERYHGVLVSDIVTAYFKRTGGVPTLGSRNSELFRAASYFRCITNNNPSWLKEILPSCGLSDKEFTSICENACKLPIKAVPAWFDQMVSALAKKDDAAVYEDEPLPPMPTDLPPVVSALCNGVPSIYRSCVALGIFSALGAYTKDTKWTYIDNVPHEATFMHVLMAASSSGKSCMVGPLALILNRIRRRDENQRDRERVWRQICETVPKNDSLPKRPEKVCIQEIDSDITNAAFVHRADEAAPQRLYCSLNEIEQLDGLKGSTGQKIQFQLICLSFDPDNKYGQSRVSANAINTQVCVRWNFNVSTTVNRGIRYFSEVAAEGPLSRLCFTTIEPRPIGSDMPIYPGWPSGIQDEIDKYCERLESLHGTYDVPELRSLAQLLVDRCAKKSAETQDIAYEHFSFRGCIIAWLRGCILYHLQGNTLTDDIVNFCIWSLDYDLAVKMRYFGDILRVGLAPRKHQHPGPPSLLKTLPAVFSIDDVSEAIKNQGLKSNAKSLIAVWKNRGLVSVAEGQNQYLNLAT